METGILMLNMGPFEFTMAQVVILSGIFLSIWLLTRTVHEKGLSLKFLHDHLFLFFFSSLFLGRLGSVLFIYPAISENMLGASNIVEKGWIFFKSFFSIWNGGIEVLWSMGGFLVIFLALCFKKNEHPLSWLDAFSLPTLLFLIFFGIGNFLSGNNYGSPVSEDFWFSVTYDLQTVRYSGALHPVQLYSSFLYGIFALIGVVFWSRKLEDQWEKGIFGGFTIAGILLIHSFLETFRGDTIHFVSIFPLSQIISFFLAISILFLLLWKGHFSVFHKKIITSQ